MVANLETATVALRRTASRPGGSVAWSVERRTTGPMRVGIVNNMPDSALAATEQQFTRLLQSAARRPLAIELYHLDGVPRGEDARSELAARYRPVSDLYRAGIDALIVTGNEPRAARLGDEPYWPHMVELIDWARDNTRSTLWSCLAAHAAVLHLDGIERRRLPEKRSGVFACRVNDPRGRDLPLALSVCHSRFNEVRKDELLANGYDIVSEASGNHVDIFARTWNSRFLFLQGHPEYAPDSLMREYRRDVGRYLNAQRDTYPEMPENYFDAATVDCMKTYRAKVEAARDARLFAEFPQSAVISGLERRLAGSAAAVFAHWLAGVDAISG